MHDGLYIISFGWDAESALVYADTLDDALTEATRRSARQGLKGEDLETTTSAEPWDAHRASDLGLLDDDARGAWHDQWRSEAPWR